MNRSEVAQLLALAAAVDKRTVGEVDVIAWHRLLDDVDYDAACDALTAWQREHRDHAAPSDIRDGIRAARASRTHQRTVAEALADHGPGDVLAGDITQHLELPAGMIPPHSGREALATALDALAAKRAIPTGSPTGFTARRGKPGPREADETSKRLGEEQRAARKRGDRSERPVDGKTDDERAKAKIPITTCHGCACDIPAPDPDDWDPMLDTSPALYCGQCLNRLDRIGVDPASLGPRDRRGAWLIASVP